MQWFRVLKTSSNKKNENKKIQRKFVLGSAGTKIFQNKWFKQMTIQLQDREDYKNLPKVLQRT